MAIKMDDLGEFSRWFAEYVVRVHPEWLACARLEHDEDSGRADRYLVIELPPPSGGRGGALCVCCSNEEVTVSYTQEWHDHFVGPEEFEEAVSCVERILSGDAVVVSAYAEGQWRGSCLLGQSDIESQAKWFAEMGDSDKFVLRSWSGEFDRTHHRG